MLASKPGLNAVGPRSFSNGAVLDSFPSLASSSLVTGLHPSRSCSGQGSVAGCWAQRMGASPQDKGAPLAEWPEGKPVCCPVGASSCDLSELTPAGDIWPGNPEIV